MDNLRWEDSFINVDGTLDIDGLLDFIEHITPSEEGSTEFGLCPPMLSLFSHVAEVTAKIVKIEVESGIQDRFEDLENAEHFFNERGSALLRHGLLNGSDEFRFQAIAAISAQRIWEDEKRAESEKKDSAEEDAG